MADAGEGGGTGAAIEAADEDHVRVGLGDPRSDGADPSFGDELDADAGARVGVLQVVDELRQVLDGVDVMVRRGGDEAHTRSRVAHLGDPGVDLGAGQLAAFAGLGALGHLDLELAGVDQVFTRDAKTPGGNLLDGGVKRVAVRLRLVAEGILAALARVAFATNAVHGNGQGFVRLLADRSIGHRAGLEALHDALGGLHLVDRDGTAGLELEQTAQRAQAL